jgi:hypothetical protein
MSSAPTGTSRPEISRSLAASLAAGPHADECQALHSPVAFDDFVRDPGECPAHPVGVHHNGHRDSLLERVRRQGQAQVAARTMGFESSGKSWWRMQDLAGLSGPT